MTPAEFVNSLPADMFEDDDRVYEDRLARQARREAELGEISKALGSARRWVAIACQRQRRAKDKGEWEPTAKLRADARMMRAYLRDALAVFERIIEDQ